MKARPLEYALVAGAAIAICLLAFAGQAAMNGRPQSIFSTYDTGPNGYRAIYEVVRRAGLPATRFERPLGLLDPGVGTLVISTPAMDPPPQRGFDAHDVATLKRFVEDGGRLVDLDDDFEGSRDIAPGVGHAAAIPVTHSAIPLARDAYTAGIGRIEAPIASAFGFDDRRGLPLLANDRGIVAMRYAVGKGEVVAVTSPQLFSNAQIARSDNARFAYNVLAGHGTIAFDEYVHGFDDNVSFWSVLPEPVRAAVWIVGAVVILGLIGANVPFAPPVPMEDPDERDSSAYIDSMAALMRRARAARSAIATFAADARRRRHAAEGEARAIEQLGQLHAQPDPSDAALVEAAVLDYRLRKDLI